MREMRARRRSVSSHEPSFVFRENLLYMYYTARIPHAQSILLSCHSQVIVIVVLTECPCQRPHRRRRGDREGDGAERCICMHGCSRVC